MSRREGRDSHSKRHHSRFDREPSPKKSRRDGKPETERTDSSSRHFDNVDTTDREQKPRRRLQDALPLEIPSASKATGRTNNIKEGLDGKIDGLPDGTKRSSDPTVVPRPRPYHQHDQRGSAEQGGRSFSRSATDHGRWSDPKEQRNERVRDKAEVHELKRKIDRGVPHMDEKKSWRHDKFYELEADAPLARKRPAFSEKKMPAEPAAEEVPESVSLPPNPPVLDNARVERGGYHSRGLDRSNKPFGRLDERNSRWEEGTLQRAQKQWPSYQSRDKFQGGATRGRDRVDERYGDRNASRPGVQVEKWKHDMFEEANRSPTPKNEEEQIAKVEALLAL